MTRYAYPLLLIVLVGIAFAPMLLHPGHLLYPRGGQATDLTITHWPAVAFNVRSWRQQGQVPLWRTTIASGGPWAANPQSWLLYPPAWLFFFLPINLTFNLLLLAHLLLAALATYAFGRRALELKPPGAALAGMAFALAPWLGAQLAAGHVNVILALAWLPVALLGAQRAATTGQVSGAMLAGVAWAAALLNHFQMAAFVVALTLGWFLLATLDRNTVVRRKLQVVLLLLMPAVALLLSAALLIPLAEALPYLNRTTLSLDEAGTFSLPWANLLTALIPTYGGEPEQAIYLGLPVALLAAVGLALKRDRVTWFLAMTMVLATLFALGTHAPLFPLLLRLVPGLGWLRVPPRAWMLLAFCLALLAGRGLDALTRLHLGRLAQRRVTLIGLAFLVAGLLLAVGLLLLFRPAPPAAWTLIALTVLAVAALLLRTRSLLRPVPFAITILLLSTIDLGLVRAAWTEMRVPADAFAWGAKAAEYLAAQPGRFRVYSPSYSLPQHTALQHDLDLADGVDPIQLSHYAGFLASAGGYEAIGYSPSLPPDLDDTSAQPDATRLGLLNVGYVAAEFPIEAEGLVLETQFGETHIYRNEQALPRAFVTYQDLTGKSAIPRNPAEIQPAQIAVYTPNRIVVKADLEAPGLLVLSEVWYPGWRALADGNEVPIQRVADILRAIHLDSGHHTIEFRYAPWTAWIGAVVSGSTTLFLLLYAAYRAWRHT
jgi:hypothetical protein